MHASETILQRSSKFGLLPLAAWRLSFVEHAMMDIMVKLIRENLVFQARTAPVN